MPVHNRDDEDGVGLHGVEHRVRKATDKTATYVVVNHSPRERRFNDPPDRVFDRTNKPRGRCSIALGVVEGGFLVL